jgi:hypothetical protein
MRSRPDRDANGSDKPLQKKNGEVLILLLSSLQDSSLNLSKSEKSLKRIGRTGSLSRVSADTSKKSSRNATPITKIRDYPESSKKGSQESTPAKFARELREHTQLMHISFFCEGCIQLFIG